MSHMGDVRLLDGKFQFQCFRQERLKLLAQVVRCPV